MAVPPTVRTLVLTERTPAIVRLRPAELASLLTEHPGRIEVMPTGRRHHHRLTALGCVGVLVTPTLRVVIHPKIPLRNFFYLLDPLLPVPATLDHVTPTQDSAVLEFLAGQFAQRLAERVGAGLHRTYRERSNHGPFLQGRLDVSAQVRGGPGRKDQLHCHFEDFTEDVLCNQLLRATTERLLGSPLIGEGVRLALRQVLPGFEGVRSITLEPGTWERLANEPIPSEYQPALELAQLLALGLAPGKRTGAMPAPAFLVDLERVFERHVTRGMVQAFANHRDCSVSVQRTHTVHEPVAEQPDIHMKPDVTVDRRGRAVLVVDAKWKRLPGTRLIPEDLYQILAYCTALGANRGVLIYPGKRDRIQEYPLIHSCVKVEVRTLRVTGVIKRCVRSLRQLGRALRGRVG